MHDFLCVSQIGNSSFLGEKLSRIFFCLPNFFPLYFSTAHPSLLPLFVWRRKEASASIHRKVFMAWRRLLSQVAAVAPLPPCLSLSVFFFSFFVDVGDMLDFVLIWILRLLCFFGEILLLWVIGSGLWL